MDNDRYQILQKVPQAIDKTPIMIMIRLNGKPEWSGLSEHLGLVFG